MSLTFKVTIPMQSLEKLQSMSPFYDAVYGIFEKSKETDAVLDVCKSVVNALKDMPYELRPKKVDGNDKSCSCDDCDKFSDFQWTGSPFSHRDDDEADDESEGYHKINAEGSDRRSKCSSIVAKGNNDLASTRETIRDDNTEIDADNCSHADKDNQREIDDDHKREAFGMDGEPGGNAGSNYTPSEVDTSDPIHVTVVVNHDGSGVSFRTSLNEYDTWNSLADKLRNMSSLFKGDMNFYFRHSFYDQNCQERLFRSGVTTDAVIYTQKGLQAYPPLPQMPLTWPGAYACMQIPQANFSQPQQVPPMYDSRKYSVESKGSPTTRTNLRGHALTEVEHSF